jgi:hypothetical protein
MALKGTLKDFGIADILQFIGQQQRSGILHLKAKQNETSIGFKNGAIVSVENSKRKSKDLLGKLLVRAELLTEAQLESALEKQRRTLTRLGDLLVQDGVLTRDRFEQVIQLQSTEALYDLFSVRSGSYQFTPGEVEADPEGMKPLRAEAVLMEGFRRVDEWPGIRRRITSPEMTFSRVRSLPAAKRDQEREPKHSPGLFEGFDDIRHNADPISDAERTVFKLVQPNRTAQRLGEISCLGQFETYKALANLLTSAYIAVTPNPQSRSDAAPGGKNGEPFIRSSGRLGVAALGLTGLALFLSQFNIPRIHLASSATSSYRDSSLQRLISRSQIGRISSALQVYRTERGQLPDKLETLVGLDLLGEGDLHYPWSENYYYHRISDQEFVLLPPLR